MKTRENKDCSSVTTDDSKTFIYEQCVNKGHTMSAQWSSKSIAHGAVDAHLVGKLSAHKKLDSQ